VSTRRTSRRGDMLEQYGGRRVPENSDFDPATGE